MRYVTQDNALVFLECASGNSRVGRKRYITRYPPVLVVALSSTNSQVAQKRYITQAGTSQC
jgi:hypothetical protein